MKWLRIILPIFLIMGMLFCINSVAYADPGDAPPEGDPGDGGNPGDGSGYVNVTVVGNNSEVGVDLYGDDNTANVNFHSENPSVNINGRNLNDPIAVYNVSNTYAGASNMGVRRVVKDVMFPYMQETWDRLNLTADGLAKVIKLAQSNESDIANIDSQISNSISDRLNDQGERLTALELEAASQAGQIETLKAQDEAIKAYIVAVEDYLRADYNRKLITIIGAFSVVVIGLAIGLYLTRRRTL